MTHHLAPGIARAVTLVAFALVAGVPANSQGLDNNTARITSFVDPSERRQQILALPSRERDLLCRPVLMAPHFEVQATIEGPVRRQIANTQTAGVRLMETVEAWYHGSSRAADYLRRALEDGSGMQAFTELVPYSPAEYTNYNPMNEPVYQLSNFLFALAHAYLIVEEEFPEDQELLAATRIWGDRLYEITSNSTDSFDGPSEGVDRRVLISQGWAHWGNVTGNRQILASAYRYYVDGMVSIGRNGEDRIWGELFPGRRTYYSNMTYGAAMAAAFVLVRSGAEDVYTMTPGGGNLVEGLVWLWDRLEREQPADLLRARHTGSRAVAWTELFVHEFPHHPASTRMNSWLEENPAPRFSYTGGGGPTTCLYRGESAPTTPGSEVQAMQQALMTHCKGLPDGFADGQDGPGTRAVLKRFQESRGLVSDGIYGSRTAAALASPADGNCK